MKCKKPTRAVCASGILWEYRVEVGRHDTVRCWRIACIATPDNDALYQELSSGYGADTRMRARWESHNLRHMVQYHTTRQLKVLLRGALDAWRKASEYPLVRPLP